MRVAGILGIGIWAVLAGLVSTGEVRAQMDMTQEQMFKHVRAISAFELGCVRDAPDFSKSYAIFEANGMDRNEVGFWVDENAGLIAGVSTDPATNNVICVVGLVAGSSDIFLRELRRTLAKQWAGEDYSEVPPDNQQEDPSFFNDSREDYVMIAQTSLSGSGILAMILSITYPEIVP